MPGRSPPSNTTRARSAAGAAFVAVRGEKADGADFVPQALARGAALIVAERPPAGEVEVPWVQVRDGRLALALLGAEVAGHPSREIPVVGVTGTNGKTTTTYLLAAVLDAAGQSAGRARHRALQGRRRGARGGPHHARSARRAGAAARDDPARQPRAA